MNKFIISTDAAADLSLEYISKHDVKVIPMKLILREKDSNIDNEFEFGCGQDGPSNKEFYDKLRDGAMVKTTLINFEQHLEHFTKLLSIDKNILHVPLSSGISGTAENAFKAAAELNQNNGANIVVLDFKGASMGQGLFVDYLVGMRDEGKDIQEAAKWGEEHILKFCHYFTVDDLGFLRRGGRVSGVSAFIGTLIKIKPVLQADNNGKLVAIGKNIGRKKALTNLVTKMEQLTDGKQQRIFISHGDCVEDAQFVAELITQKFGITDITIGDIGPIIGAHSGPGTVALFFIGKNR